jgi:hypothetical protein
MIIIWKLLKNNTHYNLERLKCMDDITKNDLVLIYLSQSEVAREIGISRAAVSKKMKNPIHRNNVRFSGKLICLQDYKALEKISPGPKAKNKVVIGEL